VASVTLKSRLLAMMPASFHPHWKRLEASPLGYRLAKGAFWSFAGAFIARGLGLVAGIFVARILGKHDFGQLGMIQSTVGMFGVLAGFGMGLTATKHVAEFRKHDPDRAGRIIGLSSLVAWATGGVMTIVLLAVAPWLAVRTLASPDMAVFLRAGALLLLLGGVNGAQTGALYGFEAFKMVARVNLIAGLSSFPITLAGAWWWGTLGAVWAQVLCLGINCLLNYLAIRAETARAGVSVRYWGGAQEWSVLWQFSLPAVLGGIVSGPAGWIANALLVNQPDGYSELGVYNAVLRIQQMPGIMLAILLAPLLPILSEQFGRGSLVAYKKTASLAFSLSLLATVPFALIQLAAPFLTLLPFGPSFQGHFVIVQWLMFDLALVGLYTPLGSIMTSMSKMWFAFCYSLCTTLISLVLVFILIPKYRAEGLCAAITITHALVIGPCLFYIYRAERAFMCGVPLARIGLLVASFACIAWFLEIICNPMMALGMVLLLVLGLLYLQYKILGRALAPQKISHTL
jgi:O-antigen/teichoic acid export membrane protein